MESGVLEKLSNFREELDLCKNISDIDAAFSDLMRPVGAHSWGFTLIGTAHGPVGITVDNTVGTKLRDWIRHLLSSGYDGDYPFVLALAHTDEVVVWTELIGPHPSNEERKLLSERLACFAATEGISVNVRLRSGDLYSFSMCGDNLDTSTEVKMTLLVAARYYVLRAKAINALAESSSALTPTQQSIVSMLRYGWTQAEIAKNRGVTIKAIEAQLAAARGRYQVRTTTQLVAEAMSRGDLVEVPRLPIS